MGHLRNMKFLPGKVESHIDGVYRLIGSSLERDTARWFRNGQTEMEVLSVCERWKMEVKLPNCESLDAASLITATWDGHINEYVAIGVGDGVGALGGWIYPRPPSPFGCGFMSCRFYGICWLD